MSANAALSPWCHPFLTLCQAEWSRYQKVCQIDGVNIPKKPTFLNKADDITALINHKWTPEELNRKLERQNELKNKFNGVLRMQLEAELHTARETGDHAAAERAQTELDNLGNPRLAFRTSLGPSSSSSSAAIGAMVSSSPATSQQERLAAVNADNRRRNAEEVRRAQLRDRARKRDIERKLERGEEVDEDHSARLRTRAKFVHDVHESRDQRPSRSGTATPANGTPKLGATKAGPNALLPHLAKLAERQKAVDKNGLPMVHKPIMDDDVIAALDLDIDDNILD
jgi:RNA polymerase-associated protein RTF1